MTAIRNRELIDALAGEELEFYLAYHEAALNHKHFVEIEPDPETAASWRSTADGIKGMALARLDPDRVEAIALSADEQVSVEVWE